MVKPPIMVLNGPSFQGESEPGAATLQPEAPRLDVGDWRLDDQVGFLIRRAQQRHLAIFADHIPDLTPTQFSTLATLAVEGSLSQNELGRRTAMDTATIKGVVDRLRARGLLETWKHPSDRRRIMIQLTPEGLELIAEKLEVSPNITDATLAPLTSAEARQLRMLLGKLC